MLIKLLVSFEKCGIIDQHIPFVIYQQNRINTIGFSYSSPAFFFIIKQETIDMVTLPYTSRKNVTLRTSVSAIYQSHNKLKKKKSRRALRSPWSLNKYHISFHIVTNIPYIASFWYRMLHTRLSYLSSFWYPEMFDVVSNVGININFCCFFGLALDIKEWYIYLWLVIS